MLLGFGCLAPLKTWFRWLSREHHILANPAADLDLPKQPKRLPRSVPSVQEVEAVMAEAEPGTAQGLRDRALLETLYATGLRRMEAAGVGVYDVDLQRGSESSKSSQSVLTPKHLAIFLRASAEG